MKSKPGSKKHISKNAYGKKYAHFTLGSTFLLTQNSEISKMDRIPKDMFGAFVSPEENTVEPTPDRWLKINSFKVNA